MSLVSEALRRARQEAAERDARDRGAPPPALVGPHLRRTGFGPVGSILLGVLFGVVAAVTAWWFLASRPAPPIGEGAPSIARTGVVETAHVAPTLQLPPTAAPEGGTHSLPVRSEPALPHAAVSLGATPPGSTTRDPGGGGDEPVRALVPPAEAAPATEARGTSSDARGDRRPTLPDNDGASERTFVLDGDLGSTHLHLDYIVFKPSAPFGSINGQRIVEGSIIDGIVVEQIARDFIRLRKNRQAIVLRVR